MISWEFAALKGFFGHEKPASDCGDPTKKGMSSEFV